MVATVKLRPWPALGIAALTVTTLLAACTGGATPRPKPAAGPVTSTAASRPAVQETARPAGPHGGVDLNVLVVTDGTPPVEAIRQELASEGMPVTVVSLRDHARQRITTSFLTRALPGGKRGGDFDGVVLPGAAPTGLSAAETSALAAYERAFGVRQADAYSPPAAVLGMSAPVYSGKLTGNASVTAAGAAGAFGYLNRSFPFSGGLAGPPAFGYLAEPLPGASAAAVTPLVTAAIPGAPVSGAPGSGALVWQYAGGGRQQLGISFGYSRSMAQFHYLAHGIVSWLTRGVSLTSWRSYLDIAFDDMILGDAQWSTAGHCTPGDTTCPPGTPATPMIRMTPADVTYAVRWEKRHDFTIEFLYNGGASARFQVNGTDPLLAAVRPVAADFYWVNHTYTHAYLGCQQDFAVVPWQCVTRDGKVVWAAGSSLVNSQILRNFAWARGNGIPAEPGVVATGEYSGLRLLPQQPADNPYLDGAMGPDHLQWVAMDASAEPAMRPVGAALGVPRHPIDIGYDVDTVASEVNEFNWYNTAKADGGSGLCQQSRVTRCIKPLSTATGWASYIVPTQARIVFNALLNGDPRPFFMHQSNLAGDRIAYPVMDAVLSAYRAVFNARAPVDNLPMSGAGAALRDSQLWDKALGAGTVRAWVEGKTVTITAPAGTPVPVTLPNGTTSRQASGAGFGSPYGGARSARVAIGARPLAFALGAAPFRSLRVPPARSPRRGRAGSGSAGGRLADAPQAAPGALPRADPVGPPGDGVPAGAAGLAQEVVLGRRRDPGGVGAAAAGAADRGAGSGEFRGLDQVGDHRGLLVAGSYR